MIIIIHTLIFILYFVTGSIVIYNITEGEDRAYGNPLQGLFAIILWPFILIYKFYEKVKKHFIKLTNLKNKQR